MQRPSPLTKLSTELRRIRRRKITRPDASKPARLHEFLPRSMPRTTMSIGPLLYLSKGQRSYADRCKRGGPSHNHISLQKGIPLWVHDLIGCRWPLQIESGGKSR